MAAAESPRPPTHRPTPISNKERAIRNTCGFKMLTSVRSRIRARNECVTEDEVRGLKSTVKVSCYTLVSCPVLEN